MLYLAREDEPERHRGTVLRLQHSVFAPPEGTTRLARPRASDPAVFRVSYLRHLRALWREDPGAFLALIELASGGNDLTLVDDWGDEPHAPRRILGAALKQLAATRRTEARRKTRRSGRQTPRAG